MHVVFDLCDTRTLLLFNTPTGDSCSHWVVQQQAQTGHHLSPREENHLSLRFTKLCGGGGQLPGGESLAGQGQDRGVCWNRKNPAVLDAFVKWVVSGLFWWLKWVVSGLFWWQLDILLLQECGCFSFFLYTHWSRKFSVALYSLLNPILGIPE